MSSEVTKKKIDGMKNRCLTIVAALASSLCIYAQGKVWTLDECLSYAVEHNTEVKQRINQQKSAENTLENTVNSWKPVVDATASQDVTLEKFQSGYDFLPYDRTNTSLKVEASMPLYTFGRLKNQKERDEFSLKAIVEDLRLSQKQVEINVVSYYLQVMYNRTEVSVMKEKLEASMSALKQVKILYEEGKKPKGEVVQAESTVSQDEYNMIKAQNDVKLSLIKLAQLLNLSDVNNFDIADISDSDVKEPVADWNRVVEYYPSVIAAKYRIESAESDIKVAKSEYNPYLSLDGYASNQYSQLFNHETPGLWTQLKNRYGFMLGVSLKYNLFNGGETKRKVNAAMIKKNEALVELENSKLQIRHDIQTAYYTAQLARDKMMSAEKAERLAKESLGFVEASYQAGRATIFDLIQSQQQWLENREEAVRSKYEYILRTKILEIYQQ